MALRGRAAEAVLAAALCAGPVAGGAPLAAEAEGAIPRFAGGMSGWDGAASLAGPAALTGAGAWMAEWVAAAGIDGPAALFGMGSRGVGGWMSRWDGIGSVQETGEARAGGRVIRVAVSADAREGGAALVSMNYRLEVAPETDAVPFTLLLFAPANVEEISARAEGEILPVSVTDARAPRLEGEIELPAALASSGRVVLDVGYRVTDAVRAEGAGVRVGLPMLAVDWVPAEARPGVFQAEVALPEGMVAREIFPVTPSGGTTPGVARASLQVLPAVVRVRARPEGSLGLSLPGVLELLVLITVIACGMAGLRFVRRAR